LLQAPAITEQHNIAPAHSNHHTRPLRYTAH
jgi:hypothetical protein